MNGLPDRPEDIAMLAQHFIDRYSIRQEKRVIGISDEALGLMRNYDFPRNVRELENAIERACVSCKGPEIVPSDLPPELRQAVRANSVEPVPTLADNEARFILEVLRKNDWHRGRAAGELGMHRITLLRRIRKLRIALPAKDGRMRDQTR
jgi:DNA-binding NtrC family response regulator